MSTTDSKTEEGPSSLGDAIQALRLAVYTPPPVASPPRNRSVVPIATPPPRRPQTPEPAPPLPKSKPPPVTLPRAITGTREVIAGQEEKIRHYRSEIMSISKKNFKTEHQLAEMEKQIKVLIKNKIVVEDSLETPKNGEQKEDANFGNKREQYQLLFRHLQSNPNYLAAMARYVNDSKSSAAFVQTVVFDMYGDQYGDRDERLLLLCFRHALKAEILETPNLGSLFRANTAVTQMLSAYARRGQGLSVLRSVLEEPLKALTSKTNLNLEISPQAVYTQVITEQELDGKPWVGPRNVTDEQALENPLVTAIIAEHARELLNISDNILNRIIECVDNIPMGMRWICKQLGQLCRQRFPDADKYQIGSIMGGYINLRFFNPVIVAPDALNFISNKPSRSMRRNLVLIAKVLQNLSNGLEFGDKEQFMSVVNTFIRSRKETIQSYFEKLAQVEDLEEAWEIDKFQEHESNKPINLMLSQIHLCQKVLYTNLDLFCPKGVPEHEELRRIIENLGVPKPFPEDMMAVIGPMIDVSWRHKGTGYLGVQFNNNGNCHVGTDIIIMNIYNGVVTIQDTWTNSTSNGNNGQGLYGTVTVLDTAMGGVDDLYCRQGYFNATDYKTYFHFRRALNTGDIHDGAALTAGPSFIKYARDFNISFRSNSDWGNYSYMHCGDCNKLVSGNPKYPTCAALLGTSFRPTCPFMEREQQRSFAFFTNLATVPQCSALPCSTSIDSDVCFQSFANGGCNYTCGKDSVSGRYKCVCPAGYSLAADNRTCLDIDECATHTSSCAQYCNNTQGSYICFCAPGYQFISPYTCTAILCLPASAYSGTSGNCSCHSGYCGNVIYNTSSGTVSGCTAIACPSPAYSGQAGNCTCSSGYNASGGVIYAGCSVSGCNAIACSFPYTGPAGSCSCVNGYYGNVSYSNGNPVGCRPINCTSPAYTGLAGACTCGAGYSGTVSYSGGLPQNCTDTNGCLLNNCSAHGDTAAMCNDIAAPGSGYTCTCSSSAAVRAGVCEFCANYSMSGCGTNGCQACNLTGTCIGPSQTCPSCASFNNNTAGCNALSGCADCGGICLPKNSTCSVCSAGYGNNTKCNSLSSSNCSYCLTNFVCQQINTSSPSSCPSCASSSSSQSACTSLPGCAYCTNSGICRNSSSVCPNINECALNISNCAQICIDNNVSYSCACQQGYLLAANNYSCNDINECQTNNGGCQQICLNSIGSFACSCNNNAYISPSNTSQCVLISCSGSNYTGSAGNCSCAMGYSGTVIYSGNTTHGCSDTNACISSPCGNGGDANAKCLDFAPPSVSYNCSCSVGYFFNGITCSPCSGLMQSSCNNNTACAYCATTSLCQAASLNCTSCVGLSQSFCNGNPSCAFCSQTGAHYGCGVIGSPCAQVDGNWSEWSQCSRTCMRNSSDTGFQIRLCNNPPPANQGLDCVGASTQVCQPNPCPAPPQGPAYQYSQLLLADDGSPVLSWSIDYQNQAVHFGLEVSSEFKTMGLGWSLTGHHHTNDVGVYKGTVADAWSISVIDISNAFDPCYPACIYDLTLTSDDGATMDPIQSLQNMRVEVENGLMVANWTRKWNTGDLDDFAWNIYTPYLLMWSVATTSVQGVTVPDHLDAKHLIKFLFVPNATDPPPTVIPQPRSLFTRTYDNCLVVDATNEVYMVWTLSPDTSNNDNNDNNQSIIEIGFTGKANFSNEGWIALGLSSNVDALTHEDDGLDGWVAGSCYDSTNETLLPTPCMQDFWLQSETEENLAPEFQNLNDMLVTRANSRLVAEFSRRWDTGDSNDVVINSTSKNRMFWSIRQDVSLQTSSSSSFHMHLHNQLSRGSFSIDFRLKSDCTSSSLAQGMYSSPDGSFTVQFSLNPAVSPVPESAVATFTMTAKTNGWLSVGFHPTRPSMSGAETHTGWINDISGKPIFFSEWSPDQLQPRRAPNQLATLVSSSQMNGVSSITFTRLAGISDPFYIPFTAEDIYLIWGQYPQDGDSTTLIYSQHTTYGTAKINLVTGKITPSVFIDPGQLLVIISMSVIFLWFVLKKIYACSKKKKCCSYFLSSTAVPLSPNTLQQKEALSLSALERAEKRVHTQDEEGEEKPEEAEGSNGEEIHREPYLGGHRASLDESGQLRVLEPKRNGYELNNKIRACFSKRMSIPFLLQQASIREIVVYLIFVVMMIILATSVGQEIDLPTRLGYLSAVSFLVVIPATRNSILALLLDLSFDRVILIHRWLGRSIFIVVTLHFILFLNKWSQMNQDWNTQIFQNTRNFWGFLGFLTCLFLFITSLNIIRRKQFGLFYWTHFAFVLFFVFSCLHAPEAWPYAYAALAFWGLDRISRLLWGTWFQATDSVEVVAGAVRIICQKHPVAKRLDRYFAGQYAFFSFPGVNFFEWHPFSILSAPESDTIEVLIRPLGGHTQDILNKANKLNGGQMFVRVDGPYGPTKTSHRRFSNAIFVAGGVGVTAVMSYINDFFDSKSLNKRGLVTKHVTLIWAIREQESVKWVEKYLSHCRTASGQNGFPRFDVKIFVTGQAEADHVDELLYERPQIRTLVDKALERGAPSSVFVCGPKAMTEEVWDTVRMICLVFVVCCF